MNQPHLADKYHCTGCMACADSCAQHAITCIINDEGHYAYKVDGAKCVLCHRCEKVCPPVCNMDYGSNDLNKSQPFAVWTKNETLRRNATSGGVFPAMAKAVLEAGGVVYGAIQERFYVHHEGIENVCDIIKLQGSKYTQSKTEGIFIKVKDSLNSGKIVLFSGLGCQVAALLSYLKGNKFINNLITIDLICGGVPSSFLIKKYKDEHGEIDSIVSYRTKERYELTIKNKKGETKAVPSTERALPLYGFTSGATKRYICYDCPFAKGHRSSDLTIGDYWGNSLFPEQKKDGVSIVIIHSEKGRKWLERSDLEAHKVAWRDFVFNNSRMIYGYAPIPSSRKKLSKVFSSYNYKTILEQFANMGSWKRPWTMVSRVMRVLEGKYIEKKRKLIVKKILRNNGL